MKLPENHSAISSGSAKTRHDLNQVLDIKEMQEDKGEGYNPSENGNHREPVNAYREPSPS